MQWKNFAAGIFAMGILVSTGILSIPERATAHCDTMNGPVIQDARLALEKGDVTPALKWIQLQYESEIREAFSKTLMVRKQSLEARELADRYFFETLVRLHRAGEGEPYTGLKEAGEVEPIISAADAALEKGSADSLLEDLSTLLEAKVKERFQQALEARKHKDESVAAGRHFVEAYVAYVHFVERLHLDLIGDMHHPEAAPVPQKTDSIHH